MKIEQREVESLCTNLGNMAARAYADGRFSDYGTIKATMAVLMDLAEAPPAPPVPVKAKRGRPSKSGDATTNGAAAVAPDGVR